MYRILIRTRRNNEAKAPLINVDRIMNFFRELEVRRLIWSWYGFLVAALSIALFGLQLRYVLAAECKVYGLRGVVILDMVFLAVILCTVLAFLVIKLVYLCLAWHNSEFYLRMRNVG